MADKEWKCDACGEAENCDISCTVKTAMGEPEYCPFSGDECEWCPVKETLKEQ